VEYHGHVAAPAGFVAQVRVELPAPAPAVGLVEAEAALAVAEVVEPLPAEAPSPHEQTPAWKADIAQITDAAPQVPFVPQLNEPGLVAGANPTLAAKIDGMQVVPGLSDEVRAGLAAVGPTEMTVRIGGEAIGEVAFRTSESGTIDVQLSGLLDLLADRIPAEEFARLRNSDAANAYVSSDDLRAIGLSLQYDPVYDELRLSA